MKSSSPVKAIASSPLLSYIYFNPIFQASRMVRKKLRRKLGTRVRFARLRTA